MEPFMPASARLLQKIKETWGDEATQDLVTWVNEGQTVNRAEVRELADLYFARFSDRLEERIALSEARFGAKLDERIAASEARFSAKLDERIAASEARFSTKLDERIAASEARFSTKLDERVAASETGISAKLDGRIGELRLEMAKLEGRLEGSIASLRTEVAVQMRDQMKWMFVFWAGTVVPLAGLIIALAKAWL
jgi:hypothetical protein